MRVVEVNSIDGLPGLRLAWRSLLGDTPGAGFHQSCEWMEEIYRHQQPTSRLRVLLVTEGSEMVGILPFVQTLRSTPLGSLRVVGYPSDRWSPFQGPIGPHPTATLMAGLRYLSDIQHGWDVLELGGVNLAMPDYQRTRTALQVADMRFQETDDGSPCDVIELQQQPNDFVASLRLVQRQPIASDEHRRIDRDVLTFERHRPRGAMYDDANPRWDLFERCLELPNENQQPDDVSKQILRNIHASACRSGAADMSVLRHGNEILACCYNVHIAGVLVCVFGGTSDSQLPTVVDRSFMHRLVARMLEDSVARHDVRWISRTEFSLAEWSSAPLRRARFVHHRQNSASRLMRRMADWLPRRVGI